MIYVRLTLHYYERRVQVPTISKQLPNSALGGVNPLHGVLSRIKPIGFTADDALSVLVYGKSGTGKTTFWSTFPGNTLAVICSGGKQPGELRSIDTPDNRKRIQQVRIELSAEVAEIAKYVAESGKFRNVVLDHASGLQDLVLKEVLGLEELPAQKSWGMASQQLYGQCAGATKDLFVKLLNLVVSKVNVIIVAQERTLGEGEDSEVIQPTVCAGLIPSVVGWLNPACDYVVQTFLRQKEQIKKTVLGKGKEAKTITTKHKVKGVEYCLRTAPDAVYTTKFRVPKGRTIPDMIVDPSYEKLVAIIRG